MNIALKPKFVEVKKGKNIVILTEDEYDQILDILDGIEAEKILADQSDPLLKWEDVQGTLVDNHIARVRKAKGVSQKDMAKRLKMKPADVADLEKIESRPGMQIIRKVAKALGCSIDDLI